MNTKIMFAIAVLILSGAASAAETSAKPSNHVVWGWGAERIVGTYQSEAQVRVCGTTLPFLPVASTITFQAGGTITESARFPPGGVPNVFGIPGQFTRNIGLGTWWYNPSTRTYSMAMRYDYFVDGMYHGIGTVDRDLHLSANGDTASGPVESLVSAVDGSVIVDVCGDAVSTRL